MGIGVRFEKTIARRVTVVAVTVAFVAAAASASARPFGDWGPATNVESLPGTSGAVNTDALEGCPIEAPDGRSLFFASNRPGGHGGIDIWVAQRGSVDDGWGETTNLPAPINSAADDFCPTPIRGGGLFFVSTRAGGCGGGDIYFSRRNPVHGWRTATHLPCTDAGGPNSAAGEAGPSYFEAEETTGFLYFSSGPNLYVSEGSPAGSFGPAAPLGELNTGFGDLRPNVRKDGLEMVFDSDRPGGLGGFDIYRATRPSVDSAWSAPINLGANVNSTSSETRASLSRDGGRLHFGSNRPGGEGMSDIYFATRAPAHG